MWLACAAASASPPPPPGEAVPAGPFMIFFDWDDDRVDGPHQAAILDRLVGLWRAGQARFFLVEGHADTSLSDAGSLDVSRRRAWAVHDFLVAAGVPPEAVTVRYHGESRLLVETADGIREPQNRRAEIAHARTRDALPR